MQWFASGRSRSSARLPLTTEALVTRLTKIHRKLNERRGKQKWGRWWRSSDLFISQEGGSPREIRAELSRPAFRKLPRVGSGRRVQRGAGAGSRRRANGEGTAAFHCRLFRTILFQNGLYITLKITLKIILT